MSSGTIACENKSDSAACHCIIVSPKPAIFSSIRLSSNATSKKASLERLTRRQNTLSAGEDTDCIVKWFGVLHSVKSLGRASRGLLMSAIVLSRTYQAECFWSAYCKPSHHVGRCLLYIRDPGFNFSTSSGSSNVPVLKITCGVH
jgi:hypothetical protein